MFILPIGHEEDEVRRWPWVSITIGGLCVLVFLGLQLFEGRSERAAMDAAREVFAYAADKPYLILDEDLLFGDTAALLAESQSDRFWDYREEEPDEEQLLGEQAKLDTLTRKWRQAVAEVPTRSLGLIPAELSPPSLVTHMFVHAGLWHLLGNLFFFWLLAPPLEDVWGRPLFALFYLAAGIAAGLLWAARYPNSEEAVVGASGAIAGLMGAFMVRFWRTRIHFVWFVMTLRIFTGSFKAPAWFMLGLWFLRELAISSLFEPHAMPGGGVAVWGHLFGFGFGVLAALAIRGLGIEERWVRPGILAATGEIQNPALERALELEEKGREAEAWSLLQDEVARHPDNWDAILFWWKLACRSEREPEVARHLLRVIRGELQKRQTDLAWEHWRDLRQRLPDMDTPPGFKVRLAEGLLDEPWSKPAIADLLASARAQLGASPPLGLMVRLARVSVRAGLPGASALCSRLAAAPDLDENLRLELCGLAASPTDPSRSPKPATEEGGER